MVYSLIAASSSAVRSGPHGSVSMSCCVAHRVDPSLFHTIGPNVPYRICSTVIVVVAVVVMVASWAVVVM